MVDGRRRTIALTEGRGYVQHEYEGNRDVGTRAFVNVRFDSAARVAWNRLTSVFGSQQRSTTNTTTRERPAAGSRRIGEDFDLPFPAAAISTGPRGPATYYQVRGQNADGTPRLHRGIDFAVPRGTPVQVTADGTVTNATVTGCVAGVPRCGGRFGNRVYVDHGNGRTTIYAHLEAVLVRVGQRVRRGEVVGRVGNTGDSRGTNCRPTATNNCGVHLHYAEELNGVRVDPMRRR